jgi:glycosyltransferase involved in cell wall biosynthesis
VRYFFFEKLSGLVRRLPHPVKRFLKKAVFGATPDAQLWNRLDEFLSRETKRTLPGRVFIIFSPALLIETEGQRGTHLAYELVKRGFNVIFVYWRWIAQEPVQDSCSQSIFCIPVDEFLKDYKSLLSDDRLKTWTKYFIMEFPHPGLMEIVNYAKACAWRTVYDVIDDWEQFHKRGKAYWYYPDVEAYLLRNAAFNTVTSENLRQKMIGMGACNIHLLPNAFEDWKNCDESVPPAVRKGRITIGFFGNLTRARFDWKLVENMAKRRPDWVFHIVGYGLDKRVAKLDNLMLLGAVNHRDLPAYAKNWDLGMIPFQKSDLSLSIDPLKIYEYISLGLHTVATGMPNLASYPGVIVAQNNDDEFEAAVEKAAQHRLDRKEIEAFLGDNRWSNRIDTLLKICDQANEKSPISLELCDKPNSVGSAAA